MGSACLLPNAQSFSSGDRDSPTHNLVAGMKWLLGVYTKRFNIRHKFCGHVFAGALQGADRGWQWQRLPQNGLQLRASQSSESQIDRAGSGTGDFPVEQLWRVSQAGGENVGPGCGRTGCWASTGRSDAFYSLGARSRSDIAAPEDGRTPPRQSPLAVADPVRRTILRLQGSEQFRCVGTAPAGAGVPAWFRRIEIFIVWESTVVAIHNVVKTFHSGGQLIEQRIYETHRLAQILIEQRN